MDPGAGGRAKGEQGEEAAAAEYLRRGYRIAARNWRCPAGEIDLVLARGDLLVFCEVKSRAGDGFGPGWESVTREKRRRLRRLAELFLLTTGASKGAREIDVRFDVASVRLARARSPSVELFEDAF